MTYLSSDISKKVENTDRGILDRPEVNPDSRLEQQNAVTLASTTGFTKTSHGLVATSQFIVACRYKQLNNSGAFILDSSTNFTINVAVGGTKLNVDIADSAFSPLGTVAYTASSFIAGEWNTFIISGTKGGKLAACINDVVIWEDTWSNANDMNIGSGGLTILKNVNGLQGECSRLYFNVLSGIDVTVESDRRKFFTSDGNSNVIPSDLGVPALYLGDGMTAETTAEDKAWGWNDGHNQGSVGTLTVVGTFVDAP